MACAPFEPIGVVRTGLEGKTMSQKAKTIARNLAMMAVTATGALLVSSGTPAEAGVYVSGGFTLATPVSVIGFSYGNPYLYGPVYSYPVACPGPVYYYPTYGVYAPYHPAFRYHYYPRPVVYFHRPHYGGFRTGYRAAVPYHRAGHGHGYAHAVRHRY